MLMSWPGIIKHSGDAELIFISDQAEWDSDASLHNGLYDEADYLVDSFGQIFRLTNKLDNYIKPELHGDSMSLQGVLGLVKAHVAQSGSCCVAKLYAASIKDAFMIIPSLEETE